MPDEPRTPEEIAAAQAAAAGSPGTPPEKGEHMIPKVRFDEVNRQLVEFKKREAEREDADKKATEAKAIKDGELQKVIDAKQAEIDALKPNATIAEGLAKFVNATINAEIDTWPDEVKVLVPEGENALQRAAEVEKLRPVVAKLATGVQAPPKPGNGPSPRPAGAPDPAKLAEGTVERLRSHRSYTL